jgi:N-acetylneuraminic acid mutarotase
MFSPRNTVLWAAIAVAAATPVKAHFLWIAPDPSPQESQVHVYFSETPQADDPSLLVRLQGLALVETTRDGKTHDLRPVTGKDSLVAIPAASGPAQSYSLNHTYGLFGNDDKPSLLVYYARMYPAAAQNHWPAPTAEQQLPLELIPSLKDGKLAIRVLWKGKPLAGAEVKGEAAGQRKIDGKTDAAGIFSVPASDPGIYAFRSKYVEPVAGEHGGKKYGSVRHYSTLVVTYAAEPSRQLTATPATRRGMAKRRSNLTAASAHVDSRKKEHALPDLPFGITSFGAGLVDHQLYVCAGQRGAAHEYSREGMSDSLLRLDLHSPKKWETVGTVPRRAGLAMVSYRGKLYRIGGFEARNKTGEEADLHSTADFSSFDPSTGRWDALAPLPKARSSHDAVLVGSRLIVVGGWDLRGSEASVWDDTALSADLSAAQPTWEQLPKPPFHRRALAVGERQGKVYALGGMQEKGGPTTTTYVLDLATQKWSTGPKLPGEGLEGFGGAAVTCDGQLYASTYSGKIWRLADDGQSWQAASQLARPRFFERILSPGGSSLIILGGANMEDGKDVSVEVLPITAAKVTRR